MLIWGIAFMIVGGFFIGRGWKALAALKTSQQDGMKLVGDETVDERKLKWQGRFAKIQFYGGLGFFALGILALLVKVLQVILILAAVFAACAGVASIVNYFQSKRG